MILRLLTLLIPLISCFSLLAQNENGVIQGRVYNDLNNEPVPFVNVIVFKTKIGAASNIDGEFKITGVAPGFIKLQVSAVGYETYITPDLMITNAKVVNINIPLKVSNVSIEEVVVKPSPFRKTEESPVSLRRIGIRDIEKSPGSNRDISKVIQSFPGVASTPVQRNDLIVRGGGPSENSFYLDDVEIPNINHFDYYGLNKFIIIYFFIFSVFFYTSK
ncbi:MAG: TonB-dependent receptor, partial [Bacteroidales bacterium]|nr:TonB-dependent receptor [Bacteroidales bacterium]